MPLKPWWELPRYAYRPQYLQLALLLQERQPPQNARAIALLEALGPGTGVKAPEPHPG